MKCCLNVMYIKTQTCSLKLKFILPSSTSLVIFIQELLPLPIPNFSLDPKNPSHTCKQIKLNYLL